MIDLDKGLHGSRGNPGAGSVRAGAGDHRTGNGRIA